MGACICERLYGSFYVGAFAWELVYGSFYMRACTMRYKCVTNALPMRYLMRSLYEAQVEVLIAASYIEAPI